MNISFIIYGTRCYQLLAPIIDEALNKKDWHVECWLNYNHPKKGAKSNQFPNIDLCPKFASGTPTFRLYYSTQDLENLVSRKKNKVIISQFTPFRLGIETHNGKWICVQHNFETFWMNGSKGLLSADKVLIYTHWWKNWALDYFKATEPDFSVKQFKTVFEVVGVPEHDPIKDINKANIREKLKIPKNKKVVLYLPFVSISSKAFWPSKIFAEDNLFKQLFNLFLYGKLNYLPEFFKNNNEKNVISAVRRFCDKNNAILLVKGRLKSKIPTSVKNSADHTLYDESFYPSTILEAASISDLCISYYSNSVLSVLRTETPQIFVDFKLEDFYLKDEIKEKKRFNFKVNYPDSPMNFDGATFKTSIPDLIKKFPNSKLDSFKLENTIKKNYLEKFLKDNSLDSSKRVIKIIENLI